jgi:D-amino-acid dehydrogenase
MTTSTYDVAVIGAGIVGVSTALHLQRLGKKVLLVDRREPGMETSYGNAGIIETSYVLPFAFPDLKKFPQIMFDRDVAARIHWPSLLREIPFILSFYRESQPDRRQLNGRKLRPLISAALREHKSLMQDTNAERWLSPHGRLRLHRTEQSFTGSTLERRIATETGVPFQVLSTAETLAIEPDLAPIFHNAILWNESARLTNPSAITKAYAEKFVRHGGHLLRIAVDHLQQTADQRWHITTSGDPMVAKQVVICAGPWSAAMTKQLGYHFPLGIKRGYHQHFGAKNGKKLSRAVVDGDIGYLICPMEQGYRITTGAEFATLDAPFNPAQIARALPFARELFALDQPLEDKAWMGSRPCFADSLPVIGAAPRHSGLWFNFGQGHSGMTIGPTSGKLLAEMLCGQKTFCDPHDYRPERLKI